MVEAEDNASGGWQARVEAALDSASILLGQLSGRCSGLAKAPSLVESPQQNAIIAGLLDWSQALIALSGRVGAAKQRSGASITQYTPTTGLRCDMLGVLCVGHQNQTGVVLPTLRAFVAGVQYAGWC